MLMEVRQGEVSGGVTAVVSAIGMRENLYKLIRLRTEVF
jgi:hypothetical protein